jgi:hypothetical protein
MDTIGSYIRRHHVGLLALIVALSGTAYAATTVGPDEIAKNAIRAKHIKKENVRGKDLRCPGTMTLRGGLCFERQARPAANWDDALEHCRSLKRRLPTAAEAVLAIGTFPAPSLQTNYWTSDATHRDSGDNQYSAIAIKLGDGSATVGSSPQFQSQAYICVAGAGA